MLHSILSIPAQRERVEELAFFHFSGYAMLSLIGKSDVTKKGLS